MMSNVALFAVLFGKKGDKARLVPRVGAYNNLQFHTAAYTFAITSAVWPAARCPATRSQKNRCVRTCPPTTTTQVLERSETF